MELSATKNNNNNKFIVGCIYIPPHTSVEVFNNYCIHLEQSLYQYNHPILMVGDFNIPGVSWDDPLVVNNNMKFKALMETMCVLNLTQLNNLT